MDLMRLESRRSHPHALEPEPFNALFTPGPAGDLLVPRLSIGDPPADLGAPERDALPRPRLQRGRDHHDAVRHADPQRRLAVTSWRSKRSDGPVARRRGRALGPSTATSCASRSTGGTSSSRERTRRTSRPGAGRWTRSGPASTRSRRSRPRRRPPQAEPVPADPGRSTRPAAAERRLPHTIPPGRTLPDVAW